jgi:hypothetical protein
VKPTDIFATPVSIKNLAITVNQLKNRVDEVEFLDFEDDEYDERVDFMMSWVFTDNDAQFTAYFNRSECNRLRKADRYRHRYSNIYKAPIEDLYTVTSDPETNALIVRMRLDFATDLDDWHRMLTSEDWTQLVASIYTARRDMVDAHLMGQRLNKLYVLTCDLLKPGSKEQYPDFDLDSEVLIEV